MSSMEAVTEFFEVGFEFNSMGMAAEAGKGPCKVGSLVDMQPGRRRRLACPARAAPALAMPFRAELLQLLFLSINTSLFVY